MKVKAFNISLATDLVDLIDRQASREYTTRSEYIRRAVVGYLENKGAIGSVPLDSEGVSADGWRRQQLLAYMDREFKYKSSYKVDLD